MLVQAEGGSGEDCQERYDDGKAGNDQRKSFVDRPRPVPDGGERAGNMLFSGVAEVAKEELLLCGECRMTVGQRAVRQAQQRVENGDRRNAPEQEHCRDARTDTVG